MSIEQAADSAVQLANANIVRAIQLISTERGHDPRDYVLVPFGGAGPLHAAHIAADLSLKTIVVPPSAGVISAYGLIASNFMQFESLTRRRQVDEDARPVRAHRVCRDAARASRRAHGLGLKDRLLARFVADMRFVGQAFEVPVELSETELARITARGVRAALRRRASARLFLRRRGRRSRWSSSHSGWA